MYRSLERFETFTDYNKISELNIITRNQNNIVICFFIYYNYKIIL